MLEAAARPPAQGTYQGSSAVRTQNDGEVGHGDDPPIAASSQNVQPARRWPRACVHAPLGTGLRLRLAHRAKRLSNPSGRRPRFKSARVRPAAFLER